MLGDLGGGHVLGDVGPLLPGRLPRPQEDRTAAARDDAGQRAGIASQRRGAGIAPEGDGYQVALLIAAWVS